MATKTKAKKSTGRFYVFGSYDTKADATHAAAVLRKDRSLRAYVKWNARTKKWDTMYAGVKKA